LPFTPPPPLFLWILLSGKERSGRLRSIICVWVLVYVSLYLILYVGILIASPVAERVLRAARTKRSGENDDDQHVDRALPAHGWHGARGGLRHPLAD
jgi:hypothetical protein